MFCFNPMRAIVLLTFVVIQCQIVQMSGGRCYNPSDKFHGCCQQIGMTSTMTNLQSLIRDACRYPPADLAMNQKMTLGSYFNEYVMCYADGHDNSQCCANAGVPSKVTLGVWSVNCQDLCRGNGNRLTRNAAWDRCSPFKPQISACNQRGVRVDTESAAVLRGFCRNRQWCQHPMGWQMACGHH
ncbi:hypothetical protein niasHS_008667 [Heterodera schachtii]|uniref:Domain of unknown function DB domain-containing protein n=1 Tax=Heterodera schachtii TaxID=97005 RepID=A0ABD2JAQ9_HETSC